VLRIVNQYVLVRKALRAMPSRLRRSESKPSGVHSELLMEIPKVADDLHPSLSGILRNNLIPLSIWSILFKGELPLHLVGKEIAISGQG
jgi:hypothetical protein